MFDMSKLAPLITERLPWLKPIVDVGADTPYAMMGDIMAEVVNDVRKNDLNAQARSKAFFELIEEILNSAAGSDVEDMIELEVFETLQDPAFADLNLERFLGPRSQALNRRWAEAIRTAAEKGKRINP
jgi:hypothetical protein